MKNKTYNEARERARLEYILGRRELELEALKEELSGEREVNSLCAAYLMYLLLNNAKEKDGILYAEASKEAVNALVGRYFAVCEDGGDVYRVKFIERGTDAPEESDGSGE